jgi:hypothetical protein
VGLPGQEAEQRFNGAVQRLRRVASSAQEQGEEHYPYLPGEENALWYRRGRQEGLDSGHEVPAAKRERAHGLHTLGGGEPTGYGQERLRDLQRIADFPCGFFIARLFAGQRQVSQQPPTYPGKMQQGNDVSDKLDQVIAPAYMGPLMSNDDPEHVGRQRGEQRGRDIDLGPRQARGECQRAPQSITRMPRCPS